MIRILNSDVARLSLFAGNRNASGHHLQFGQGCEVSELGNANNCKLV